MRSLWVVDERGPFKVAQQVLFVLWSSIELRQEINLCDKLVNQSKCFAVSIEKHSASWQLRIHAVQRSWGPSEGWAPRDRRSPPTCHQSDARLDYEELTNRDDATGCKFPVAIFAVSKVQRSDGSRGAREMVGCEERKLRSRMVRQSWRNEAINSWAHRQGVSWSWYWSVNHQTVQLSFRCSYMFFLPERDYMGRRVIFYRPGVADSMSPTVGFDVLALMTMAYDLILSDEENQIRGVVHLSDAKGIKMSHFTIFSPQFSFRIGKNTEVRNDMILKIFADIFNSSERKSCRCVTKPFMSSTCTSPSTLLVIWFLVKWATSWESERIYIRVLTTSKLSNERNCQRNMGERFQCKIWSVSHQS